MPQTGNKMDQDHIKTWQTGQYLYTGGASDCGDCHRTDMSVESKVYCQDFTGDSIHWLFEKKSPFSPFFQAYKQHTLQLLEQAFTARSRPPRSLLEPYAMGAGSALNSPSLDLQHSLQPI